MEIIVSEDPSKNVVSEIQDNLKEYNSTFLSDVKEGEIACYINDDCNNKIAGIVGRFRGNWLLLDYLWVSEKYKNKGLGSKLLQKIEELAENQGCKSVFLDTFNFQANEFYEKFGYENALILQNFPVKDQLHYMIKHFS